MLSIKRRRKKRKYRRSPLQADSELAGGPKPFMMVHQPGRTVNQSVEMGTLGRVATNRSTTPPLGLVANSYSNNSESMIIPLDPGEGEYDDGNFNTPEVMKRRSTHHTYGDVDTPIPIEVAPRESGVDFISFDDLGLEAGGVSDNELSYYDEYDDDSAGSNLSAL